MRPPVRAFLRRYVVALGVAAVLMVGGIVAVNYAIDRKIDDVERVHVDVAPSPPDGGNYLLIGSDTRAFVKNKRQKDSFGDPTQEAGQRSDTIMVVHVEPGSQRTLVMSFPRDLWVDIPGVGMSKINAAFNTSADKVVETLKANFGIDINHYVQVDFESFRGIVNEIGNVPVYFPYPARDEKTGLRAPLGGCYPLDGQAALDYVRSRSLEYYSSVEKEWLSADIIPDIGRIKRQQDFMRKVAGIAVQKSLNNPLTANEVADQALANMKFDQTLDKEDVFALIEAFRTIDPNDPNSVNFQTIDWEAGPDQRGQSVLYIGPGAKAQAASLNDFSDKPPTTVVSPETVTLSVLNGSGRNGIAKSTLRELVRFGFVAGGSRNAGEDVEQTEVRYRPGARDKGKLVLKYVDPQARLVEDASVRGADVALVLGADFRSILVPGSATTSTMPAAVTATTAPPPAATPAPADPSAPETGEFGPAAPRERPC